MFKYCIEQWDFDNKKWFEIGGSTNRVLALKSVYDIKKNNLNNFYRIVMVIDIV